MDKCIICGDTGSLITIGEKGAVGINKAAQQRGSNLQAVSGQSVHKECRRQYTNSTQINKYINERDNSNKPLDSTCDDAPLLRSSQDVFTQKAVPFLWPICSNEWEKEVI